jgi:hypothetical protein
MQSGTDWNEPSFRPLHVNIQFLKQQLLKRLSFLYHMFWDPFVKNQLAIVAWIYVWVFCSIGLHVCFCANTMLFLLLWLCNISLKSDIVIPSALDFLLRITLAVWGLLCFYMICRIYFSVSVKNVIGILIGIALNM